MRVAQKTIYETYRSQLGKITDDLTQRSLQVSTGKRINSLRDDPVGVSQVLSLKSNVSDLEQLERNINTGGTWLDAGETALTSVMDIVTEVKSIAMTMRGPTVDSDTRRVAAEQVRGHLLQIESLSNTMVNGQYLFAGTKTDTIPFALDDQNNPTAATYSGNNDAFTIKTGKDTTLAVGHDGDAIFSNLFSTLIDLKGYLEGNDVAGVGTILDDLDIDFDQINSNISEVGVKGIRLDTKKTIITDLKLSYSENRAELEEVDIIEAVSKLQTAQLAYQAALASSAKVMSMSLLDYL